MIWILSTLRLRLRSREISPPPATTTITFHHLFRCQDRAYQPLWYWAALCSLTTDDLIGSPTPLGWSCARPGSRKSPGKKLRDILRTAKACHNFQNKKSKGRVITTQWLGQFLFPSSNLTFLLVACCQNKGPEIEVSLSAVYPSLLRGGSCNQKIKLQKTAEMTSHVTGDELASSWDPNGAFLKMTEDFSNEQKVHLFGYTLILIFVYSHLLLTYTEKHAICKHVLYRTIRPGSRRFSSSSHVFLEKVLPWTWWWFGNRTVQFARNPVFSNTW